MSRRSRDTIQKVISDPPPAKTRVVDQRHITVRLDDEGRKIGLDKTEIHWSRLSLRAQQILERRP